MNHQTNQNREIMSKETIIPTKENPTFIATCSNFGSITGQYKATEVNGCEMDTFGINFVDTINDLHQWIKENQWCIEESPKCKFEIYAVDGSVDKHGEAKWSKLYTISASKAKKYIL